MSYLHFTLNERTYLHKLLKDGYSIRQISDKLGRSPSSISRELKRNSVSGKYHPYVANSMADARKRKSQITALPKGSRQWKYVLVGLRKKHWSPETICGRWQLDYPKRKPIHFSTIYRYIYKGLLPKVTPQTHLRRRGKLQTGNKSKFNTIHPDRIIPEWPKDIQNRERFGDWEGDTILGGVGKGLAITLVDRRSRFLLAGIVPTKAAAANRARICEILQGHRVHSISFDNGVEFAEFHQIEKDLNTLVYFAEPHKPWQRGTNENTNDRLRFYFPKGCDFKSISEEELQRVVYILNNTPRKCLGWRTPAEVYYESVALA